MGRIEERIRARRNCRKAVPEKKKQFQELRLKEGEKVLQEIKATRVKIEEEYVV